MDTSFQPARPILRDMPGSMAALSDDGNHVGGEAFVDQRPHDTASATTPQTIISKSVLLAANIAVGGIANARIAPASVVPAAGLPRATIARPRKGVTAT
jgi:hypothetical protein